jgi:hypothetical protein
MDRKGPAVRSWFARAGPSKNAAAEPAGFIIFGPAVLFCYAQLVRRLQLRVPNLPRDGFPVRRPGNWITGPRKQPGNVNPASIAPAGPFKSRNVRDLRCQRPVTTVVVTSPRPTVNVSRNSAPRLWHDKAHGPLAEEPDLRCDLC